MTLDGKRLNPEFLILVSLIELCQRDIAELKEEKPPGWKSAIRTFERNMREMNEELKFVSTCE